MTKIPSVEERVESLQVTSKLETNEQYLERVQKIMQQDRLATYKSILEVVEELDKEIINMQGGLRNNVVDTKDLKEKIDTLYGVSN